MALAGRTAVIARDAGGDVVIVTGDATVSEWATGLGLDVLDEGDGSGLDAAAQRAVAVATERTRPWLVLHADLPWLGAASLRPVLAAAAVGHVLVPASDGGSNIVGGTRARRFSYGPGSFHRHLAATPDARIVVDPRLSLDLDRPADLGTAVGSQPGRWLLRYLS